MANLTVSVRTTKNQTWEGVVNIQGLSSAKLARRDGATSFATRAALNTVARQLAQRLQLELVYDEPVKRAAKKSLRTTSQTSS